MNEAANFCHEALKQDPRNFDATHLLGVIHHQKGEFSDAVSYLEHPIGIRPDSTKAQSNLAAVQQQLGIAEKS